LSTKFLKSIFILFSKPNAFCISISLSLFIFFFSLSLLNEIKERIKKYYLNNIEKE